MTMRNGVTGKKTASPTKRAPRVETGSGNVFADLGLPNPELALAKAEMVRRIRNLIKEQGFTQAKAGEVLGLDQPKVSALLRGAVEGYTLDRLFRYLGLLGQRVEISVRPKKTGVRESAIQVTL